MKCPACDETNHAPDAKYCHICGARLHKNKVKKWIKGNAIFILGILGMGMVCVGTGLMGVSFGIGVSVVLVGGGMMIGAIALGHER